MIGKKTMLCLLVASIFLMPISAVKDRTINMEEVTTTEEINVPVTILNTGCIGGDDEPEITDDEGDTRFGYVDVLWASFYEVPDEPEYLYAAMKIADLEDKIGTVYAIHWHYDDMHYDVAFHNGVLIPQMVFEHWSCAYHERRRPVDTWNDTYNTGYFDLETGVITWKIHKSCIGNPQPGDVITQSYVFTAQRISKLGLIPFGKHLFASFSDATDPDDSEDYIIQY
ncbi:MAG: hypothetical protein U9O96_05555 [Candidatus Thermoplasmatota archaeon]|nr:hypothetical protein [Candidatus Thermoplasmatota archaeon]